MQTKPYHRVLVVGSGNFGTCLACHLARIGHTVTLWSRDAAVVACITQNHRNPAYLSSILLPASLQATLDLEAALEQAEVVVLSIPTQAMRSVLLPLQGKIRENQLLISASKGIELGSHYFVSDIVRELLGTAIAIKMAVLSGPSFAIEVAEQLPTAVTVASADLSRAQWAQRVFHSPQFRAYTSSDPVGLEVAGALKNVIAIATGACIGLGLQENSRAALITRGLAEMARVGKALGADPLTFGGLGGVGDLFLTCSSSKSRNFTVGFHLGKGKTLKEAMELAGSVAEGVTTTRAAIALGSKLGVRMGITSATYQVLFENKPVREALSQLITRDASDERE
jgi:glycerol-3-phosphate dehydrogenase (NAD(P)+)